MRERSPWKRRRKPGNMNPVEAESFREVGLAGSEYVEREGSVRQSTDYDGTDVASADATQGWRQEANGDAEFQDARIRGDAVITGDLTLDGGNFYGGAVMPRIAILTSFEDRLVWMTAGTTGFGREHPRVQGEDQLHPVSLDPVSAVHMDSGTPDALATVATIFVRSGTAAGQPSYAYIDAEAFDLGYDDVHAPWTLWSPSRTNWTVGNGVQDAAWQRPSASTCRFRYSHLWGTTSSFGGPPSLELPFTPAGDGVATAVFVDDSGTTTRMGALSWLAGDPTAFLVSDSGFVGATVPFTWTDPDAIRISGEFEIA